MSDGKEKKEIAGSKLEHDIRNDLQTILWALEIESGEDARRDGKKAVQSILSTLKEARPCK